MATRTTYYNLIKPSQTDPVDVRDLNTNFDNIDAIMHTNEVNIDALDDRTTTAESDIDDLQESTEHLSDGDVTYPYASEIEIEDALGVFAKNVSVKITAQQDLHGYDHPWAGGAGKNLYIGSPSFEGYTNISFWTLQGEKYNGHDVYKKSSAWGGTANHFSVGEGTYTFSVMVKTGSNTNAFIYTIDNADAGKATVDVTSMQVSTNTSWTKVQCTFTVTSAGLIAPRIELGSDNDIYISEYQLEQGSTATTFEPYENICPISGWDECEIDRVGKNLYDKDSTADGYLSDAYIFSNGTVGNNSGWTTSPYIRIKPNTSYVISGVRGNDPAYCFYDKYKNYISGTAYGGQSTVNATAPNNARYIRISAAKDVLSVIQFEEGSTATHYEPYQGKTYIIQFGDTIYGGKVNLDTGKVIVDRVFKTLGESDYNSLSGNSKRMNLNISGARNAVSDTAADDILISNILPTISSNETYNGNYGVSISSIGIISIATGETLTVASAKQFLSTNTPQIVYPLSTPITIQLTPQQIQLLEGYNYLTANTGDIQVTTTDIQGAIGQADELIEANTQAIHEIDSFNDSIFGTMEKGTTASKAYAQGDYFVKDKKMCKALTSIAQGATFTLNTNYAQYTLAEILKTIEQS